MKYRRACDVAVIAAEVVPQLGLFISLLGSVSSTALALVFPPLCDLALHWGRNPGPQYLFDGTSLLLACVGFCTGSVISLQAIIAAFFSPTWNDQDNHLKKKGTVVPAFQKLRQNIWLDGFKLLIIQLEQIHKIKDGCCNWLITVSFIFWTLEIFLLGMF